MHYITYLCLVTHQTRSVLERFFCHLIYYNVFEYVVPRYVALRKLNTMVVIIID